MGFLAQEVENVSITDNKILDEWVLPFGQWIDQMVDWIDQNMSGPLSVIRWPFEFLLENLVDNFIADISWIWVCLGFFIVGSLVRNVKIGVTAAVALAGCGLLGTNYWFETARTIGMILVAVILCALIGIPIGIMCGRFDGVWNVVRPTLDAMQVVHAFVYMLPIIFFFSFGVVPGTMVTMIFAIPPLIRLTNLGIRQVPEDVVEASRAFGAPEMRVLIDVQLPLARPAIMTGLNQTLLLSISMIGIAAIMGAGGLGLLVFRAVSNLDVALAASAGLALFLVAVVLDRISQPEAGDGGSLFTRIQKAWAHRSDPETLLDEVETKALAERDAEAAKNRGDYAPLHSAETIGMGAAILGGLLAVVSVFMTWGSEAGVISGYARQADENGQNLVGVASNGFAASGGSWFGYIVFAAGLYLIASAVKSYMTPGRGIRWLSPDGAALAAGAAFGASLAYWMANPSNVSTDYVAGSGVLVAVVGSLIALTGAVYWLANAPYGPLRPLADGIGYGRIVGASAAVAIAVIAIFSGWTFDKRANTIISDDLQAQLDEVVRQVEDGELNEAIAAQTIQRLNNSAIKSELVVIDGKAENGAGLGWPTLLLAILGAGLLLPAAGVGITDHRQQWVWSALSASAGLAIMSLATAWVVAIMRVADPRFFSGAGAFLAFLAGFFLLAASRGTLGEFRRRKVYEDLLDEIIEQEIAEAVHLDHEDAVLTS